MPKVETKKQLLDRMLLNSNHKKFSLKEIAWAYVHGAAKNTVAEEIFKKMLIAKAKEL